MWPVQVDRRSSLRRQSPAMCFLLPCMLQYGHLLRLGRRNFACHISTKLAGKWLELEEVSTPRKRPALLATGGAQAMAEVAEELKFQQKWFNENRPRWMPYLSQEAKQYRGVQPFSMQKAQELEDYLKGIGAFKGRVL
ncbi:unnamed protein product [Durusdinium trenchii]|uniref:Uncharacterized protein n=1 Tax=Durusdinium trenchii TaxID=1381693 RepID=A0ABP0PMT7_9DINO